MSFGPELLVVRNVRVSDKVNKIALGCFNPTEMPQFPVADPTYEFLNPSIAKAFERGETTQMLGMMALDLDTVVWGVYIGQELGGFASINLDDTEDDFCYYSIVLHPQARNRGVGGLVTDAVLQATLSHAEIDNTTTGVSQGMTAVLTAIHPDNVVSQHMCERAGFVQNKHDYYQMSGVNFLSYQCHRLLPEPIAKIFPM